MPRRYLGHRRPWPVHSMVVPPPAPRSPYASKRWRGLQYGLRVWVAWLATPFFLKRHVASMLSRFLVALPPALGLLLFAKHLFVAAKAAVAAVGSSRMTRHHRCAPSLSRSCRSFYFAGQPTMRGPPGLRYWY